MNDDFLYQPPDEPQANPYQLGARSKDHINEMFKQAETNLRVAISRLQDAQEKFIGGDWADEAKLAAAEENLEAAEERMAHCKLKYAWEWAERWKEKPSITKQIVARTKSLLLRLDWYSLLKKDPPPKRKRK